MAAGGAAGFSSPPSLGGPERETAAVAVVAAVAPAVVAPAVVAAVAIAVAEVAVAAAAVEAVAVTVARVAMEAVAVAAVAEAVGVAVAVENAEVAPRASAPKQRGRSVGRRKVRVSDDNAAAAEPEHSVDIRSQMSRKSARAVRTTRSLVCPPR